MMQKGQALILIIVAGAVAITVISAATFAAIASSTSSARDRLAKEVYYTAEAGAEDALLRLVRNQPSSSPSDSCPNSAAVENYSISGVNIQITYATFLTHCVVFSTAKKGSITKKIQAGAFDYKNYATTKILNPCCWAEIQ